MKRVLLFTLEYPPDKGGIAAYLYNLHKNLGNVVVERARGWALWPKWLPMIWRLFTLINEEKIDLVAISHILPVGYAALVIKWITGRPFTVFLHGLDVQCAARSFWKRMWFGKIIQSAEYIITNSEYTKNLIAGFRKKQEPIVIYPCISAPAPILGRSDPTLTLLSVGRLVKRKNHGSVLLAFSNLKDELPNLRYVIVGDGPERTNIEELRRKFDLEKRVELVGQIDNNLRDAYYEEADIFILPSISTPNDAEGFGVVFLEAARFGLPAIAGRGGGVDEAVLHNKTGLLVNPESIDEITEAIRRLAREAELRRRLGEAARARAARDFVCEKRLPLLKKIYE